MARETICQTPGATFKTLIGAEGMACCVEFGRRIPLTEDECKLLELNIHNALELVMRPYFEVTNVENGYTSLTESPPESTP